MQELIKIEQGENLEQLVSARDLYEFLESKQDFTDWIKNRIEKYGFIENENFTLHKFMVGKNWKHDYILKLDTAKEIAMVEGNEKGRQARLYFIEIEKYWNSPDKIMAKALQIANKTINDYQKQILEYKPKAEFYDDIMQSDDTIDIGQLAKTLNVNGIGRNKLFEILREKKILDRRNIPYQNFVDAGYFRTIETSYTSGGDTKIHIKTVVFQKGVDYIRKILKK